MVVPSPRARAAAALAIALAGAVLFCAAAIWSPAAERQRHSDGVAARTPEASLFLLAHEGSSCADACASLGLRCDAREYATLSSSASALASALRRSGSSWACTAGEVRVWPSDALWAALPIVCTTAFCGDWRGKCMMPDRPPEEAPSRWCRARPQPHNSRACLCTADSAVADAPYAPPPPSPPPTPPPVPPLPPAGDAEWLAAGPGESCELACEARSLVCDLDAIRGGASPQHAAARVRLASLSARGSRCAEVTQAAGEVADAALPRVWANQSAMGGTCMVAASPAHASAVTCAAQPPAGALRLCACAAAPSGHVFTGAVREVRGRSLYWRAEASNPEADAGFSWYMRVLDLYPESYGTFVAIGGSWMRPLRVPWAAADVCGCGAGGPSPTPWACGYCQGLWQVMEGGVGYGPKDTRHPWWIPSGASAAGYWGAYGPHAELATAARAALPMFQGACSLQLNRDVIVTNRLVLPPGGFSALGGPGLLGNAVVLTPLCETSPDDARNCWTYVLDAANWKGPVSYVRPDLWQWRVAGWEAQSAHVPDFSTRGIGIESGGGVGSAEFWPQRGMHSARTGAYRIPKMRFRQHGGRTVLTMGFRGYGAADVYGPLADALAAAVAPGGSGEVRLDAAGLMRNGTPAQCPRHSEYPAVVTVAHGVGFRVGTLTTAREGAEGDCVWSVRTDLPDGRVPEYFDANEWPIDESAAPAELRASPVPPVRPDWTDEPVDTAAGPIGRASEGPSRCYTEPGPADARLFCVRNAWPAWLAFRWYRFADQPALQSAGLSSEEKAHMQARIAALHRYLDADRANRAWIKPRGAAAPREGGLARLDPATIVTPPAGLEVGHVPIGVYHGVAKPAGCDVVLPL